MSFAAEACTIMLSNPAVAIGNRRKGTNIKKKAIKTTKSVHGVRDCLLNAMFTYLRLWNGDYNFKIDDPVPDDHPRWLANGKGCIQANYF